MKIINQRVRFDNLLKKYGNYYVINTYIDELTFCPVVEFYLGTNLIYKVWLSKEEIEDYNIGKISYRIESLISILDSNIRDQKIDQLLKK